MEFIKPHNMKKIEDEEPDPRKREQILVHTGGVGWRILVYNPDEQRRNSWDSPWCLQAPDGTFHENRVAIHHWAYLR